MHEKYRCIFGEFLCPTNRRSIEIRLRFLWESILPCIEEFWTKSDSSFQIRYSSTHYHSSYPVSLRECFVCHNRSATLREYPYFLKRLFEKGLENLRSNEDIFEILPSNLIESFRTAISSILRSENSISSCGKRS